MTQFIVAGLGNPDEEYDNTRHNIGKDILEQFAKHLEVDEWKDDKKAKAKIAKVKLDKNSVTLVCPKTFMNQSGLALKPLFVTGGGTAKSEQLILIHDEMDLPLGTFKIVFNRGSGGHRGVESVASAIKSTEFTRIRVGVSPATSKGVAKKPKGEDAVVKFILGKFKPAEIDVLKKVSKRIIEALDMMLADSKHGRERAMGEFNGLS